LADAYVTGESGAWAKMVELAAAAPLAEPISRLGLVGRSFWVHRLGIDVLIRLMAGRCRPSFMETAAVYPYEGFNSPVDFLRTRATAADGRSFDIRNQFEHSYVLLSPKSGVAGFHLVNWNERDVSYGRLLVVHPEYWGCNLGVVLLGLQAEEADRAGVTVLKHKVHKENALFIGLLRKLGHTNFSETRGAENFWTVHGNPGDILLGARKHGYMEMLH